MVCFAYIEQACETFPQSPEFGLVFLLGIVDMFEFARRVYVVAGVDTHLLHYLCCRISHIGLKMDVRNQGNSASDLPPPSKGGAFRLSVSPLSEGGGGVVYSFQRLHLPQPLCSETDQFRPRSDTALRLGYAPLYIVGRGICHSLDTDRRIAAYIDVSYFCLRRFPA